MNQQWIMSSGVVWVAMRSLRALRIKVTRPGVWFLQEEVVRLCKLPPLVHE